MPVPTIAEPAATATPKPQGQPAQKSMTKAERRELQEKQRAAKAALKGQPTQQKESSQGKQGGSSIAGQTKAKAPSTPSKKSFTGDIQGSKASTSKDLSGAPGEDMPPKQLSHGLRIFSHFGQPKPVGHTVKGDIHPAIIRLGLLYSDFKICGANARCIAMLTAFKQVIQDYTTPSHSTLSRHLMTHLSPQITHLVSARPMSVTMGNAIRELKLEISGIDIDVIEQDAKELLYTKIDNYIRDRIIIADEVIQELAGKKIKDGDVILTYAKSSVVEKVLLEAQEEGKKFSVIVVDSKPLLEGKVLLRSLTSGPNPIPCTYALLPALPSLLTQVTMVLVGAHALFSNGAVYSRAGTAMIAMMAKTNSVPVVVCCETYKFSDGVMVDGFTRNELAPLSVTQKITKLQDVKPTLNLDNLNPLYDLTPPTYITAVVTEVGLIPPSSISSIPLALGKASL
ncbi:putative translation initiation factor eIF-2B subunit delta [Psilocybe cubensis]|uniref:Translation initiation factor eIF-2B subunit delta n=2 Tax=Psilocybe cubensis TaxID=181762 RepID=A0ACB8H4J1_PSICU|nr:putative translation initiation factor eIF-2B subunit delta [Psilocybe cubensis]KAH9482426.1 putative translation initiation factor eIF-2B subunit delta [Psilocybe cubensis]